MRKGGDNKIMKKSLVSLVIAMLVLGAAAGASYALFFDRTQVKGMSISTGNADLKIGGKSNADCVGEENGFCDSITYTEYPLDNLYPGFVIGDKFRLTNVSDSEISLMVEATLNSHTGDGWDDLKNVVSGRVIEYGSETDANTDASDTVPLNDSIGAVTDTDWQTMRWWANNSPEIVSTAIDQDGERHFVLWLKVDENAGNEIAGKSVDLDLEFTGTQVAE